MVRELLCAAAESVEHCVQTIAEGSARVMNGLRDGTESAKDSNGGSTFERRPARDLKVTDPILVELSAGLRCVQGDGGGRSPELVSRIGRAADRLNPRRELHELNSYGEDIEFLVRQQLIFIEQVPLGVHDAATSAIPKPQHASRNTHHAIRLPRFAIRNPQSATRLPQYAIRDPRNASRKPLSLSLSLPVL
jgi:hypothetical protein